MIKYPLAILFIALTYINFHATYLILAKSSFSNLLLWVLAGAIATGFCCHVLCRFQWLYVFAHEGAHWFAAKLCRRRTGKFRPGINSGSVEVENPNTFIMLAPYFFPTLTVLWLPFWFILKSFHTHPMAEPIFFMLIGSSFAHHIYMTVLITLTTKQTDFDKPGHFYSACIIFFTNTATIFILLVLFSHSFSNFEYWTQALKSTTTTLQELAQKLQ